MIRLQSLRPWIVPLAMVVSFFTVEEMVFLYLLKMAKRPVTQETAKLMPVFIITSEKLTILPYYELADFLKENPKASLLIPSNKAEDIRRQLREGSPDVVGLYDFRLEQLSSDRQRIFLNGNGEDIIRGWYESTDREVFPQYEQFLNEGNGFTIAGYACPLTALLWLLIGTFHGLLKKRPRQT